MKSYYLHIPHNNQKEYIHNLILSLDKFGDIHCLNKYLCVFE